MSAVQGATRALLERDAEVEQLAEVLARASERTGGAVLVEGPAGIGKTELLRAARRLAPELGLDVLRARGSELDREFAGGIARQLFEAPLAACQPRERRTLLEGAARLAAPVLRLDEETAVEGESAAVHGLYWLCVNLAERSPLLILVDDLHWSDTLSLRFLCHVVGRVEELPVAVVAAARPGEPDAPAELVSALAAEPVTAVVRPRPLTLGAVSALVEEELGAADAEFVAACHAATLGTPFLVRELVRACAAEGLRPRAAASARVQELVPPGVSHSILVRLNRLPRPAKELARAAAVLGQDADLPAAASLAGLSMDEAASAVDLLVAAWILTDRHPLCFVHPLVRAAVRAELSPTERSRAHAAAAELLRSRQADPGRIAVHLLETDPSGSAETVSALRHAARVAAAQGSPGVAVRYLCRALAEPPPSGERPSLLLEIGLAEAQAWLPEAARHLQEALATGADRDVRLRAAAALGRHHVFRGEMSEAVQVLERATSLLGPDDVQLKLALEGAAAGAALLSPELVARSTDLLRRLEAEVERRERVPWNVLGVVALWMIYENRDASHAGDLAERALTSVEPPSESILPFFYHPVFALQLVERHGPALSFLDAWTATARASGSAVHVWGASAHRASIELRLGDLARTVADAEVALQAEGILRSQAAAALLSAQTDRGDIDERLFAITPTDTLLGGVYLHARGAARLALNRPREALADLEAAGRIFVGLHAIGPVAAWRSTAALAHLVLDEADEARRLAFEELELARAFGCPRALGVALRAAGLVEGGRAGLELLREAVETLAGSEARLEHARALADLGAALRRDGNRSEARQPLRQGLDAAARCGATALAERARTELVATGARPRRLVLTGAESLSPSERRVADLAAQGLTNREIAQALFVTTRTVEGHLTSAYRKLGVSSRDELPEALCASSETA